MAKFRKKPVVIEATQWFQNGDHPEDACVMLTASGEVEGLEKGTQFLSEGKVVRYFRRPDVPDETSCKECGHIMYGHGWIETREGGHIVCPGDWVITGVAGEKYPCKPEIFSATYYSEDDPTPGKFLQRLADRGGAIVSSASATEQQIFHARATGTLFVDDAGLGYILKHEYWRKIAEDANERRRVLPMKVITDATD